MARRKLINEIYKASAKEACKIVNKETLENGDICFSFKDGLDVVLPAGTTDKEAIKHALKYW